MYYSYTCPACGRLFYTFNDSQSQAAQTLSAGIMQHAIDYGEEHKASELEWDPETETNNIYSKMTARNTYPSGGYELK